MAFSIDTLDQDMLAYLRTQFVQPVYLQGVPDIDTVKRNTTTGEIDPYIALQIGMPVQEGSRSMAGVWGDDYKVPVYIQTIAPEPEQAKSLANKVFRVFLGQSFPWSGDVRQRSGGPVFPLTQSTGSTEAYSVPLSFGVLVQLSMEA